MKFKNSKDKKQPAKEVVKYGESESRQDRSKRTMLILSAIALVLILAVGGLIWMLISFLGGGKTPSAQGEEADVKSYLTENWPVFRLQSWDPETGKLELDYPLRFTYDQMEKYGSSLDELQELPAGNYYTVTALKAAAYEDIGVSFREVTVYGLTTDGAVAYTVYPDGSIQTCWDAS